MKKPDYPITPRYPILPYGEGVTLLPYGPIYGIGPRGRVSGDAVTLRDPDRVKSAILTATSTPPGNYYLWNAQNDAVISSTCLPLAAGL